MVEFVWPVAVSGYRWTHPVENRKRRPFKGEVTLVAANGSPNDTAAPGRNDDADDAEGVESKEGIGLLHPIDPSRYRTYRPLIDHPTLFREFVALETHPDAIRSFANRYGLLIDPADLEPRRFGFAEESETAGGLAFQASSSSEEPPDWLDFWINHIDLMRSVVSTWEALRRGSATPAMMEIAARNVDLQIRGRVEFRFSRDPKNGQQSLRPVPRNLIGALWMQVAQTLSGTKEQRQCPVCWGWFEIAVRGRADKTVCSATCRSRAHRRRKKFAEELRPDGRSVEGIAAQMPGDREAVKTNDLQTRRGDVGGVSEPENTGSANPDGKE